MRAEAQAKYDKDRADYDACEAFFKKAEAQVRRRPTAQPAPDRLQLAAGVLRLANRLASTACPS